MDGWNTTFLLGRPIFRCYVSFRECNLLGQWLNFKLSGITYLVRKSELTEIWRWVYICHHMRGPSNGAKQMEKVPLSNPLREKKHHPLEGAGIRICFFGTLKNWCMVSDLRHDVLIIGGYFLEDFPVLQKTLGMLVHLEESKQNHQNAEWPGELIKIERYTMLFSKIIKKLHFSGTLRHL